MSRTDLTEQQWATLAPLLPKNPKKGHAYKDHWPVLVKAPVSVPYRPGKSMSHLRPSDVPR